MDIMHKHQGLAVLSMANLAAKAAVGPRREKSLGMILTMENMKNQQALRRETLIQRVVIEEARVTKDDDLSRREACELSRDKGPLKVIKSLHIVHFSLI